MGWGKQAHPARARETTARDTHTAQGPKKKAPPDMKLRQQSLHACVSQQRPKQPRVDTKEPPSRRHSILTPGALTWLPGFFLLTNRMTPGREKEQEKREALRVPSLSSETAQNNRRVESQTTCLCHVPFISVRQMALRWVGVTSIHP